VLKSTPTAQEAEGNTKKFLSYREAWARIRLSIDTGFFFEAVTLEESVISDRLISFLRDCGETFPKKNYSFSELIKLWRKYEPSPIDFRNVNDLQQAVDRWRERRNDVVHGIVKERHSRLSLTIRSRIWYTEGYLP
jgi:hypothetical protein